MKMIIKYQVKDAKRLFHKQTRSWVTMEFGGNTNEELKKAIEYYNAIPQEIQDIKIIYDYEENGFGEEVWYGRLWSDYEQNVRLRASTETRKAVAEQLGEKEFNRRVNFSAKYMVERAMKNVTADVITELQKIIEESEV
jgi:hypothetical protein